MFVTRLRQGTCSDWFSSSSFDSGIGGKDNLSPISLLRIFSHGSRPKGLLNTLKKREGQGRV